MLAPAAIGFASGRGLGARFTGDLLVGLCVPQILGGPLFRFRLSRNGREIVTRDRRLRDHVADNRDVYDLRESETLLIGRELGVVTDIETGPNGHLCVVSLGQGEVYEIGPRGRMGRR